MLGVVFFGLFLLGLFIYKNRVSYQVSDSLEQFRALPYVNSTNTVTTETGVIQHDLTKAYPGYNLFSNHVNKTFLLDMQGKVVHQWSFPADEIVNYDYAELLDNGEIIGIDNQRFLVKLNEDSEVIWSTKLIAHHDVARLLAGGFLTLMYEPERIYQGRRVKFDAIAQLSETGEVIDRWSSYEHLEELKKHYPDLEIDKPHYLFKAKFIKLNDKLAGYLVRLLRRDYPNNNLIELTNKVKEAVEKFLGLFKVYEYFHTNTIEVLPDNLLGKTDRRFQAGNWLVASRHADLIFIIDKDTKEVVWGWGPGEIEKPHMPTMLNNGNLLIFDNGTDRGFSRIIELDPMTKNIVWEYKTDPPKNFYSKFGGSNQLLPNGNILIGEPDKGRAFEIIPSGQIVWEFISFEERKDIYRMIRYPKTEIDQWLK